MLWSANSYRWILGVVVVLTGTAATPQCAQGQGLEVVLAEAVSQQWGVEPSAVRIEVGSTRADATGTYTDVRLSAGRSGHFSAVVHPKHGRPRGVRFRAGVVTHGYVATRDLLAGDTLTADDLARRDLVVWGRAESKPEPGPGWIVRGRVAAGDQVAYPEVSPPPVIQPGDAVRVVISRGSARVEVPGTAIQSAQEGKTLQVRLESSRGIVRGVARGRDLVVILDPHQRS